MKEVHSYWLAVKRLKPQEKDVPKADPGNEEQEATHR
jgi:hypothetical protein